MCIRTMPALVIPAVILVILFILWRWKTYNDFWRYIMTIPGPKSYPVIGNTDMLMLTPESVFEANNKRCEKYFPIFKVNNLNWSTVFLMDPEDIEKVLSNMKHITKGTLYDMLHVWLGTGLLTSTGNQWQHRRKILTPAFHFNILQQFIDIFNKESQQLVDVLKVGSSKPYINVLEPIAEFSFSSIGETSLGIILKNELGIEEYRQAVNKFGNQFTYRLVRPWLSIEPIYYLSSTGKQTRDNVRILHDFSSNVIRKRKMHFDIHGGDASYSKRKRLAMVDLLLQARHAEGIDIDDNGIREEMETLIFEGHDPASLAICYSLLVLANYPETQKKVLQEIYDVMGNDKKYPNFQNLTDMKYMDQCIKEVLRLFPSIPVISRILGEEISTSSGLVVPKGANVNIMIYNMHHSPQVWDDPEKFDPDRFLPENIHKKHSYAYLPFSAGPRNCIGQQFAMLEIKAALSMILQNFELEAVDKISDIKIKTDLVLRPAGEIRIKFVPRNHHKSV